LNIHHGTLVQSGFHTPAHNQFWQSRLWELVLICALMVGMGPLASSAEQLQLVEANVLIVAMATATMWRRVLCQITGMVALLEAKCVAAPQSSRIQVVLR
jgi:hypothetical protein